MKWWIVFGLILLWSVNVVTAQRVVPKKDREQRKAEKQEAREQDKKKVPAVELRWDVREIPHTSKGVPEVSAWHAGTAGVIASDAAEISLFRQSRIGFSKNAELLFRLAEEPFLPNIGMKYRWWHNKRFAFSTELSLAYYWPVLKIMQKTGFKELVPEGIKLRHGLVLRPEAVFSWLMNPTEWGCPVHRPEMILSMRAGVEAGLHFTGTEMPLMDYMHARYHSRLLSGSSLYYGGLQFDSYFGSRFHYSVNTLYYNVDFGKDYAVEANLQLTYYITRHWGVSAVCKAARSTAEGEKDFFCLPLLDLTYIVNPGRGTIRHGLYKNKRFLKKGRMHR